MGSGNSNAFLKWTTLRRLTAQYNKSIMRCLRTNLIKPMTWPTTCHSLATMRKMAKSCFDTHSQILLGYKQRNVACKSWI